MYVYRLRKPTPRRPILRHAVLRYPFTLSGSSAAGGDTSTLIVGGPNPRRYDDASVTFYEPAGVRRYSSAAVVAYDTREVRRYSSGEVRRYG